MKKFINNFQTMLFHCISNNAVSISFENNYMPPIDTKFLFFVKDKSSSVLTVQKLSNNLAFTFTKSSIVDSLKHPSPVMEKTHFVLPVFNFVSKLNILVM